MSDINWQNDAVCYGDGRKWFANTDYESDKFELVNNDGSRKYSLYGILNFPKDFQLNEIREGDFIPASELDTEQKYNDVVDVFGLFGFELIKHPKQSFDRFGYHSDLKYFGADSSGLMAGRNEFYINSEAKRKLTYSQIMAIGKLKRMMLEREKSAHKTAPDLTPDLTPDFTKASSNKYEREITDRQGNSATVDVYDVI